MLAEARFTLQHDAVMEKLMHQERLPDNAGLAYRVPKIGTVTAQAIGEAQDLVNPQQIEDTLITFTPVKDGVQVIVTREAVDRTQAGLLRRVGKVMGNAMVKREEQNLLTLLDGFSTQLGGAGTNLTVGHHLSAIARVKNGGPTADHEPGPDPIFAVYHPFMTFDLLRNLAPVGTYPLPSGLSEDVVKTQEVTSLGGARIFQSGFLVPDANDDAKGGVFSKEAIWFITTSLRMRMRTEEDASLDGAYELNMFNEYAYGEYNDLWGIEMFFDAAAPTS
jgi:hypothetical protein